MKNEKPPYYTECPQCGDKPFNSLMRGKVFRETWRLQKRDCTAVICFKCKEIVGWENPYLHVPTTKEDYLSKALGISRTWEDESVHFPA